MIFFDIVQDGHKIQVMCNKRQLEGVSPEQFKKLYRLLRRGDAFCMTAHFSHPLYPWINYEVFCTNSFQLLLVNHIALDEASSPSMRRSFLRYSRHVYTISLFVTVPTRLRPILAMFSSWPIHRWHRSFVRGRP